MMLTEKPLYNQLYQNFISKTNSVEKQCVINELKKEALNDFTFHLFNENYKSKNPNLYSKREINISDELLKEIVPYLINSKVKIAINELGEQRTEERIKNKLQEEFKIEGEAAFGELAKFLAENNSQHPSATPVLNLEDPGWIEQWFGWLIRLFVTQTARECRNEAARARYNQEIKAERQYQSANIEYCANMEIEVLRKHLRKQDTNLNATEDPKKQDGSLHKVQIVNKQGRNAEWVKKNNSELDLDMAKLNFNSAITDLSKRETLVAEFMRFFIPETPKYRMVDTQLIISKKVGLNREDGTYAAEIKTCAKVEISEMDKRITKAIFKIWITSALVGNYDCHLDNIMYSKDQNGEEKVYPIDFGASCVEMEKMFTEYSTEENQYLGQKAENTLFYLGKNFGKNFSAFKDAVYEISTIWHKQKNEIIKHIQKVGMALEIPKAEVDKLKEVIEANHKFLQEYRAHIHREYEWPYGKLPTVLPAILLGEHVLHLETQKEMKCKLAFNCKQ